MIIYLHKVFKLDQHSRQFLMMKKLCKDCEDFLFFVPLLIRVVVSLIRGEKQWRAATLPSTFFKKFLSDIFWVPAKKNTEKVEAHVK